MRRGFTGIFFSVCLLIEGCGVYERSFPPEKEVLKEEIQSLEKQVETLGNTLAEKNSRLELLEKGPGLKKKGYQPAHALSCGPRSLSTLLNRLGEKIDAKDVSKEILKYGGVYNFARNSLGLIYDDFTEITFPDEIASVLLRREYAVKRTMGSEEEMLKTLITMAVNNALGIVRLSQKNGFAQHYESFPPIMTQKSERGKNILEYADIPNYFGKGNTIILEIYEVERKSGKSKKQEATTP